jgi:hypothetical protein
MPGVNQQQKGKSKYTLAPIDSKNKPNNGMMIMPPPFPQMAAGGLQGNNSSRLGG